jgi:hypothetical protein
MVFRREEAKQGLPEINGFIWGLPARRDLFTWILSPESDSSRRAA